MEDISNVMVEIDLNELRIRYETEKDNPYLDNVGALSRYFIWADKMRYDFHRLIIAKENQDEFIFLEYVHIYMSYWYGALFVLIEGWQFLKLHDEAIDKLLESPYLDLLRRYRNAVFHFQSKFSDKRFVELMLSGEECVDWVRQVHAEFGRYFLTWWKSNKSTPKDRN